MQDKECLRDIDLEDEALSLAIRGSSALSMRFARSVAGEEYGRVMAWEEKPDVAVSCKGKEKTILKDRVLTSSEHREKSAKSPHASMSISRNDTSSHCLSVTPHTTDSTFASRPSCWPSTPSPATRTMRAFSVPFKTISHSRPFRYVPSISLVPTEHAAQSPDRLISSSSASPGV